MNECVCMFKIKKKLYCLVVHLKKQCYAVVIKTVTFKIMNLFSDITQHSELI